MALCWRKGEFTRMFKTALKKSALLGFAALLAVASTAAQAEKTVLTQEDIEKIVHGYIEAHPEVILKSVETYQKKGMAERQAAALKQNHDLLFKDDRSPFVGNEKGDVTMIEFFDYNCGYCKKVFPEIQGVIAEDKNVKVIFKDLPILGPTSEVAAKWALAAHKQQKYFAFHQKMMEHQGPINDEVLTQAATDAGLDVARIKADIEGTDVLIQLERNRSLASELGLAGTPAFIVGDEILPGGGNKEALKAKIEDARKKLKKEEKPADKKAE